MAERCAAPGLVADGYDGESERPEAPIDAKSDTNRHLNSGECRSNQDCNYVLVCVEPGGSVVGLALRRIRVQLRH